MNTSVSALEGVESKLELLDGGCDGVDRSDRIKSLRTDQHLQVCVQLTRHGQSVVQGVLDLAVVGAELIGVWCSHARTLSGATR